MQQSYPDLESVYLLVFRLERLSADSPFAHRASGVKGALLRWITQVEQDGRTSAPPVDPLVRLGERILIQAARAMRK